MPRRPDDDTTRDVARLYDEYGASLYRYALVLLTDAAAAEDVVHQVFSAVMQPGRGPIEQPDRYLRRAVRNECYSWLRRQSTQQEHSPFLEPVDGTSPAASAEERLALETGLRMLPPEQRDVIYWHVYEGRTFREIAEEQDESINTIASRYRYALGRLKAWLDGTPCPPRGARSTADDVRS
jgi:RNA polymerase sigma-70 factor (ECF subfamily)